MKQHITIQDLEMLNEKGKEEMQEWWEPALGDWVNYNDKEALFHKDLDTGLYLLDSYNWIENKKWKYDFNEACIDLKKHCLPLLSIGQMIEFIGLYYSEMAIKCDEQIIYWFNLINKKEIGGLTKPIFGCDIRPDNTDNIQDTILCDVLWQACVEILNN